MLNVRKYLCFYEYPKLFNLCLVDHKPEVQKIKLVQVTIILVLILVIFQLLFG